MAFFLFIISHNTAHLFTQKLTQETDRYKYSLLGIRALILIGLAGLMFFIGLSKSTVYLFLLILNAFLFLTSYIVNYADGKVIFEVGMYGILVILLSTICIHEGPLAMRNAFSLLIPLLIGIYGFLKGIIGIFYPIEKKYTYQLLMLGGGASITVLINGSHDLAFSIFLSLFFLTIAYLTLRRIKLRKIPKKDTSTITARKILAGERITKKLNFPKRKLIVHEYLTSSPKRFQQALELPNLLLLGAAITLYIIAVTQETVSSVIVRYRLSLGIFLINTFCLKKSQFISNISRFAIALVVNFSLYSALLTAGRENLANILPILILRTLICQIALFYIDRLKSRFLFSKKDYFYRIIVTCGATIVNIILLFQLKLPGQFLFFLTFLYAGVELLMLYYIFQYLHHAFEEKAEKLQEKTSPLTV